MKFFVDTAKIEDIKKANEMGVICGVTTNPSLIAKEGGKSQEEVLKEIKESLTSEDDEEDSSTSTLKDYYMDNVIELVADQVVDEVGTNFTQQLYEQMKRNYNID